VWTLSALNGRRRTDWCADVGPTTYNCYHRTTAIAATDAAVAVVFVAAVLGGGGGGGGGGRIVRNIHLPVCVLARNANRALLLLLLLLLLLFHVFDNDDGRWLLTILTNRMCLIE